MSNLTIITTSDGSPTIRNEITGDTYHSVHGAIQESNHVFLREGFHHFLNTYPKGEIKILEIGFGTGLNALLTLKAAPQIIVEYTTLELYPLNKEIYSAINLNGSDTNTLIQLHAFEWEKPQQITPAFTLIKRLNDLLQIDLPQHYFDVVYFDAFAPNSQPELWTTAVFEKIKKSMSIPSVLVTYCAKGQVKRNLRSAGFTIQSIPGPPGKREMTRAILF